MKNPQRTLPLSLVIGVGLVCGLYFLANIAYLVTLPLAGAPDGVGPVERGIRFAANDRVATAVMEVVFGGAGSRIMAVLILVSTFGCINGLVLAGARVYYAMARDGLFFRAVGELNAHGVPRNGLIIQCVWACLLTLSGTYGDLLDYVIFAVLVFYVLTIAGLFVLRIRQTGGGASLPGGGLPGASGALRDRGVPDRPGPAVLGEDAGQHLAGTAAGPGRRAGLPALEAAANGVRQNAP